MFSLYATKNLMTGEGGFATTDDDGVADRLRLFRNHGMRVRYYHEELGTNFKPTDLAAAHRPRPAGAPRRAHGAAPAQRRLPRARSLARDYLDADACPEGRDHVWHQYVMRFPGERQAVIDGLTERGIGTLIYYPVPIHKQAYLQRYVPGAADLDLPVTNRLSDEVLAIPVHPMLSRGRPRDDRGRRARRRHAGRAGDARADGRAPLRIGPRRPGLDGPQPPAGDRRPPGDRARRGRRTRMPDAARGRHRPDRCRGLSRTRWR